MYEELDIPESSRELSQRGSTPCVETNGSARAGSGHAGGQGGGGKPEADLVVLGCHLVDFWTNIALCQSLIVEAAEDDGLPIYQVWSTVPGPFISGFQCIRPRIAWAASAGHRPHKTKSVCMRHALGGDRASHVLMC